ncbi:MAG: MBL fold metallo-hydrolase [Clostridia bacterium]|nr:MBL fold metallo-hydrolase [Clostridia bacterium]
MINFCNLYSGSTGNCTFVSSDTTNILIDAGVSCQKISKALSELDVGLENIDAILITHEHIDHTKGITTISKKYNIPIYATSKTWDAMKSLEANEACKEFFVANEEFHIGDLKVMPFSIPHDAADPCAFSIYNESKKVTVATDMGHVTSEILQQMEDSNILLLESNYDRETLNCGPYPYFLKKRIAGEFGHLSNEMASKAIAHLSKKGVQNFVLGHLSKENNFPELAYQTVLNELNTNHIDVAKYHLSVANRDKIDNLIQLA